jgi:arylsulfatase A-like enzyme
VLRPSAIGATYLTLLTAWALAGGGGDADLGRDARDLTTFVNDRFGAEVSRAGVALIATAIAIGAVLGAVAGLLVALRDRMARAPKRSPIGLAWRALLVVAAMHAWLFAHAMAKAPQLYAAAWYAQGGIRRTLQVIVTDVVGVLGLTVLGCVLLFGFLAGPPSQWRAWPRRLRRAFMPRARRLRRRRSMPPPAVALLALSAALVVPTSKETQASAPESSSEAKMNVLVLAADSLRADRLDARVAPRLSALAARGTRFDRAYVSLPRTFPSWVTLLTGRHPHHHGIRSMFPRWDERTKDFDALPQRLAREGWRTEVVSDFAGDIFSRVDLGFGHIETPTFDFKQLVRQRAVERATPLLPFLHGALGRSVFPILREMNHAADPDLLADDAIRAIRRSPGAPFFVTVFFSTAHFPYAAPAPYYARFTRPAYRGRFKYHKPVGLGAEAPPDDEDAAQVRALYDGSVAAIDAACARILAALESASLAKRTIVVITSDHGETLYEGGHGQGHGDHLFGDEGTHVPLVIVDPRKSPGAFGGVVRDVDLAPTLYALTGVKPPDDLDGRSLVPAIDGAELPSALGYAETGLWFTEEIAGLPPELRLPYPGIARMTEVDPRHGDEVVLQRAVRPLFIVAKHRMVRDDRFKLVYAPTRMGAKYMLFDTQADPLETRDVAADRPAELARLKSELIGWMSRDADMRVQGDLLVPRDLTELGAAPSGAHLPGTK